ncbi:hypothetical protein BUE80_DR007061 [Diplocarpon rosae]|nr:hypothetical protein BUE80_DR007061 [Diplocarpon rosae]
MYEVLCHYPYLKIVATKIDLNTWAFCYQSRKWVASSCPQLLAVAPLSLLFFCYMTWSTLVLSQPPLEVEIIGTLEVRALFFVLFPVLFFIFDSVIPGVAAGIKRQGAPAPLGRRKVAELLLVSRWLG